MREAFIKLAETGLVQVLPSRGTYVTKISVKEVLNARFVREAIECAVVREASGKASPALIDRLNGLIEAQSRAAARQDNVAFTEHDEAFHRSIADCLDCDYAVRVVEAARTQTDRVRHLSLPEASPFPVLIEQHRAIVAALAGGILPLRRQRCDCICARFSRPCHGWRRRIRRISRMPRPCKCG